EQLLDEVFVRLRSDVGIDGNDAVAGFTVTAGTGNDATRHVAIHVELFTFGQIRLCAGLGGLADGNCASAEQHTAGNNQSGKHTLHEDLDDREFDPAPLAPRFIV